MMHPNDIIETAARIGQLRPNCEPAEISKALVKLQKLCDTLYKRFYAQIAPEEAEAYARITTHHIGKAESLAAGIGGTLVTRLPYGAPDKELTFALMIDGKEIEL